MLSLRSARKTSITWWESTPRARHTAPSSLAKPILRPWKALSAYLIASAVGTGTRKTSPGSPSYSFSTVSPLAGSSSPTTVLGGSKKSRTLVPSRRNSGLTATPMSTPASPPTCFSRSGTSRFRQVPGSMVERKTTVCRPPRSASAAPISSVTRSKYVVHRLPLGSEGVPTQTSDTSLPAIASRTSPVARRAPEPTTSAISSPIRSSTTGARPPLTRSTLTWLTSTPMTSCPIPARHAADTQPT